MTSPFACPDVLLLQRLLLGRLTPEDSEPLAQHLLHCDRCAQAVQKLPSDPVDGVASPEPKRGTIPTPVSANPADAVAKHLAPPEGPGEIGRLGSYRIIKILGSGAMAVVFHAEDLQLGREVALKVLRPAMAQGGLARRRFLREARTMASLDHDHIVAVFQVDEDRGLPFLAMPLLKGETLHERLRRQKESTPPWLSIAEAVRIGREIAEGLAAAHDRGLIHRDIKPANIWLETRPEDSSRAISGGRVKLLDFGIVRVADDEERLTASGVLVGTPAFMAPEQAFGDRIDSRCDLFSLGCVLYRMATGQLAFNGPNSPAIVNALKHREPPPPREINSELPNALSELIQKLLAKDREHRPRTARDVVDALRSIEQAGISAKKRAPQVESPPSAGRDGSLPREGSQFGRYRIVRRLGQGAMGTVFLASDTKIDRQIALKIPHLTPGDSMKTELARFHQEARAAARLMHPNICTVYDFGEINGVTYATMAFVDGELLSERIRRERMPPADAVQLVQTIARAMSYAHRHGVIHRDLKPANIMLDRQGNPKIMDFGLARRTDSQATRLTAVGETLGTLAYMAPEQLLGEMHSIGPQSDVYSLGVILYEAIAGSRPLDGSFSDLVSKLLKEEPRPVYEHVASLRGMRVDGILRKALAKTCAARFASMDAFADALSHAFDRAESEPVAVGNSTRSGSNSGVASGALTSAPQWQKPRKSRSGLSSPVKILIGAAAVALLIAAAWYFASPHF